MIKDKKILIVGAGGFIGGHLVKKLLDDGNSIVATDIKPKEFWFQDFDNVKNYYARDMKEISNCREATKNIDYDSTSSIETVFLLFVNQPCLRIGRPPCPSPRKSWGKC